MFITLGLGKEVLCFITLAEEIPKIVTELPVQLRYRVGRI